MCLKPMSGNSHKCSCSFANLCRLRNKNFIKLKIESTLKLPVAASLLA